MKHLEIFDETIDFDETKLDDKREEVESILQTLKNTMDYGSRDMLLCKLESILKERNIID